MDGAPVRFLRREGEHRRDRLGGLDLDGVAARRAGEVGGLRRFLCESQPAHLVGPQRHRVGEHHGIVDHDPGRDEHEPAAREPMPPRGEEHSPGDREDGHHCAGDPRVHGEEQRPGDDRRGPDQPAHHRGDTHRRGRTERKAFLIAVGRRLHERSSELGGVHREQRDSRRHDERQEIARRHPCNDHGERDCSTHGHADPNDGERTHRRDQQRTQDHAPCRPTADPGDPSDGGTATVDGGLDRLSADDRDEHPGHSCHPRKPAGDRRHSHRVQGIVANGNRFGRKA